MQNDRYLKIDKFSDEVSADNAHVRRYIDGLTGRIDELVDAALEKDWQTVRRIGASIAGADVPYGSPLIARTVRGVRAAMHEQDEKAFRRHIMKVIGPSKRVRAGAAGRRMPKTGIPHAESEGR